MAIDDPKQAFEQQYMQEESKLPLQLAKVAGKLGFPDGGFVQEIALKVAEVLFDDVSMRERVKAMWELYKMEISHIEKTVQRHEDVQRGMQLSFLYDRYERDNAKRERYVRLIGNALRSEKQIHDVATFIQNIEQLNERDVSVLRVLNEVMNREGDWRPQANPGVGDVMKVHPNTFTQRSQELAVQIGIALGQKTDTNLFSREEGYGICNRLQGFGLAHEIGGDTRELPLTNYCFRLSTQGIMLLKLLGEDVSNFNNYFKE